MTDQKRKDRVEKIERIVDNEITRMDLDCFVSTYAIAEAIDTWLEKEGYVKQ